MTGNEKITLKAELRGQGKHNCRTLRKEKRIPAVVYGPKMENVNISISEVDADRYASHKFDNTIFEVTAEGSGLKSTKVIRKRLDRHPLSRRPVHIDFYALDMTSKVRVNIELVFEGKPAGAQDGGVLQEIRREVEIECLATDIPSSFTVDVTAMDIGDVLHAKDIKLPDGIKLITGEDITIASVIEPKEEEIPEPTAAAEGEGAEAAEGGEAAPAGEAKAEDKKEDSKE